MIKNIKQLDKKDHRAVVEFTKKVRELLEANLLGVFLFGSKMTGQDTPESDIDILVLVKSLSSEVKDAILDLAFDVNLKHEVYISPRVISQEVFEHPIWHITPFIQSLKTNKIAIL